MPRAMPLTTVTPAAHNSAASFWETALPYAVARRLPMIPTITVSNSSTRPLANSATGGS
jgi:hypothetical protein